MYCWFTVFFDQIFHVKRQVTLICHKGRVACVPVCWKMFYIADFLTLLNSVYLVRIVLSSVHYIDHRPKKETTFDKNTSCLYVVWHQCMKYIVNPIFCFKTIFKWLYNYQFFLNSGPGCRYKNMGLLNVKYCNFDKWMFAVVSTTQSDFFRVSVEKNINGCKLFFWIVHHVVSLSAWGRWWRVRHNSWKNVA